MKIDELKTIRDKARKSFIDDEAEKFLAFSYQKFSENNFFIKLFYLIFRFKEYQELFDEFSYLPRYISQWNNEYFKKKLSILKPFFSALNKIGIDPNTQQKEVIISESRAQLVLAGAGSGKTLTTALKVKYLVDVKHISPDTILLLAFTKKAAEEISERIKNKLKINLAASTFHSLGYKIISETEGKQPNSVVNPDKIIREFLQNQNNFSTELKKQLKQFIKSSSDEFKGRNCQIWLTTLLTSFISAAKSKRTDIKKLRDHLGKTSKETSERENSFLYIAETALSYYKKQLDKNNEIDFNDMILKASEYVEKGLWKPNYTHIIIDEYQDISYSRYKLIKALREKCSADLFCIGDDWQSIFRFTGSDLSLLTDFNKYWGKHILMRLEKTYRNSQEAADIASGFILKNPHQIAKQITSQKHSKEPVIILLYEGSKLKPSSKQEPLSKSVSEAFLKALNYIYKKESDKNVSILLLGRNNADINMLAANSSNSDFQIKFDGKHVTTGLDKFRKFNIEYLTIHKSKGLEADYTVLINLRNGINGFPCRISDDPLMSYVLSKEESFPNAEERRLFYVAITRSKNSTFMLVPNSNHSIFASEIMRQPVKYL